MKIIFLDFDGVLHSSTGRNPAWCRVKTLARVLRDHPAVRIIVSSSWREFWSLDELRRLLGSELGGKVDGVTPVLSSCARHTRQAEIEAWLSENSVTHYLALDDMPELFEPACPWLIATDPREGLNGHSVLQLRTRLNTFSREYPG